MSEHNQIKTIAVAREEAMKNLHNSTYVKENNYGLELQLSSAP